MVCIEKRPHKMRGRSLAPNFIYLTCLLDRGHIKVLQQWESKLRMSVIKMEVEQIGKDCC